MANLLKKITIGNPLFNLGFYEELAAYDSASTDEELATIYHALLDLADKRQNLGQSHTVLRESVYSMIAFSTGRSFNVNQLFI